MPKLWNHTIENHRRAVRDATLDTTAALVDRHGLRGVTMSQIAEETGIGRATLYKYFRDVESILREWHERRIEHHLKHLAEISEHARGAGGGLKVMLRAFADISAESHGHHASEVAAMLHHGHVARPAEQDLHAKMQDALERAAAAGTVRTDVGPDELASYCLHALSAAATLNSEAAVERLVNVTLDGLRPQT